MEDFSLDIKEITSSDREKMKKHKSFCIWFTGLSGSGKSTLAGKLEILLFSKNIHTYILDGDIIRKGLNKNLSFTPEDRHENIRRAAEIVKMFLEAGVVVLATFISPYQSDREFVESILPEDKFIEIYVNCNLETCIKRDPKGLYKNAKDKKLSDFTGVSAPYEIPVKPDIIINNGDGTDLPGNVKIIYDYLKEKEYLN
jgi:adenylylsulfate kinase